MKTLFIGIDALDKDLLVAWAKAGCLPTFAGLFDDSAWSATETPEGLYVGAVWPSIFTAVTPVKNARYCWKQIIPGTYEFSRPDPDWIGVRPIWEAISDAGKRVAVFDIPLAPFSPDLNGVQILDWGTHDPLHRHGMRTLPETLSEQILERFGAAPSSNCDGFKRSAEEFSSFCHRLKSRVSKRLEIIQYLRQLEDWDCLFVGFTESHCVGHQCWHLLDPAHAGFDQSQVRLAGNPILEVYQAIDASIGALLGTLDKETLVVVMSSHGMGPHYAATSLLETILDKLDTGPAVTSSPATTNFLEWVWNKIPRTLKRTLRPMRNKIKTIVDPRTRRLSSRRFFKVPNSDAFGGIRLNLIGRESSGRVAPGDEYKRVCRQLCEDLLALKNVDNGEPIVSRVVVTDEIYRGPYRDHLPDLLVEWSRSAPILSICSPKTGRIDADGDSVRTGDHKPEGIVFIRGAGIRAGEVDFRVSAMDIGPTITDWLGVVLPDSDGRSVLKSLGDSAMG